MIGYFVIILLAAGSVLAAALFFRHRQKQVMDGLSDMLEAAINGTFSETTFDESRQSSLENRLAQYLAASELSVRSIDAEREKAAAKGLAIAFSGTKKAEEGAPVYAYFDKKWSMEALGNILDNAIKYTNTGGITIKLCSYELFACVEVTDTGIGIGEEEHAAVFGRFYRGNAVAEKSGVGIGLYLARFIMQQQGGYIRLSSVPGAGSTFGLYFPTAIVSKL